MKRSLVFFAIGFFGCFGTLPRGDTSITADLACETSRCIVQARQGLPPTPAPTNVCDNCDGTGKIGDGRIVMECPVCKGTGKKTKTTPPVCVNGVCR